MNVVLNHMLNWHLSFPVGIDFCMDGENVLTMHKLKVTSFQAYRGTVEHHPDIVCNHQRLSRRETKVD